jgi:hypothetical protein
MRAFHYFHYFRVDKVNHECLASGCTLPYEGS